MPVLHPGECTEAAEAVDDALLEDGRTTVTHTCQSVNSSVNQ